jgi:hypothetical protein
MPADDYTPPPRSLLWAKPVEAEDGPGIELGCDCGTVTVVVIVGADRLTVPEDVAATCDGCNSVRWITVGPLDELERMQEDVPGDH